MCVCVYTHTHTHTRIHIYSLFPYIHIFRLSTNKFRIVKIKSFIPGKLCNFGNEWSAVPADFTNIKISGGIVLLPEFTSVFGWTVYFSVWRDRSYSHSDMRIYYTTPYPQLSSYSLNSTSTPSSNAFDRDAREYEELKSVIWSFGPMTPSRAQTRAL